MELRHLEPRLAPFPLSPWWGWWGWWLRKLPLLISSLPIPESHFVTDSTEWCCCCCCCCLLLVLASNSNLAAKFLLAPTVVMSGIERWNAVDAGFWPCCCRLWLTVAQTVDFFMLILNCCCCCCCCCCSSSAAVDKWKSSSSCARWLRWPKRDCRNGSLLDDDRDIGCCCGGGCWKEVRRIEWRWTCCCCGCWIKGVPWLLIMRLECLATDRDALTGADWLCIIMEDDGLDCSGVLRPARSW